MFALQPDTVWTRTYGSANSESGESVQPTSDGGYIIAGIAYAGGTGTGDFYLIKTDAGGDTAWTRKYGGAGQDAGQSVQQRSDRGYIVAGLSFAVNARYADAYLTKTYANGDTAWTRKYGGAGGDGALSVQQTSDGGYVFEGETSSFGADSADVLLAKTNAIGDTVWMRTYGGAGWESGYSVQQTSDGGYIVAGYTGSFGAGGFDVYLIRTDAYGDVVWTQAYRGTGQDVGHSVQETSTGKYIIAGLTSSFGAGSDDVYLIRLKERRWKVKDKKLPLPPMPGPGNGNPVVALNSGVPAGLVLHLSTPSPFSEETVIRFSLPRRGEVNLSIHDVQGRLVSELVGEVRPPGTYSVAWDGKDFSGAKVPGGIYFVHLETRGKAATSKIVVASTH